MKLTPREFQQIIWTHYAEHGRIFPWRHVDDPYKVLVSEIMLQQTQTHRVVQKYLAFIQLFPTIEQLVLSPLKEVLKAWQGLGYNRRGMYLHQTAQKIYREFQAIVPNDPEILVQCPGIGKATASSICAFAYNNPTIFIETNIRSVFIYFFFPGKEKVHDQEIFPLVKETVDQEKARDWYYALMDYGVMLKKQLPNPSRKSAHHTKQSKFEGSDRQIRGMIIKILTAAPEPISRQNVISTISKDAIRVEKILDQLIQEELVCRKGERILIR